MSKERFIKQLKIVGLCLIIVLACLVIFFGMYYISWLNTYYVYTNRTPVAQIEVSEAQKDDQGNFANLKVTLINHDTALAALFGQSNPDKLVNGDSTDYKVYGDIIYVSGPIVVFKDNVPLIDFKTMYKLASLYGKPTNSNEVLSPVTLNSGAEEWDYVYRIMSVDNIAGNFYNSIIENTQMTTSGIPVGQVSQKYAVYMTNLGFMWEKSE